MTAVYPETDPHGFTTPFADLLPAAQLALAAAVDQLTQPEQHRLQREPDPHQRTDDGCTCGEMFAHNMAWQHHRLDMLLVAADPRATSNHTQLPSLLDQLMDAVQSSTSQGVASNSATPAPIGLVAAALVAEVERTVRWGTTAWPGRHQHPELAMQVRAWASRSQLWRSTAPNYLLTVSDQAQRWVAGARKILDPQPRFRPVRDTACPVCEHSHARVEVDGERQRVPALLVDAETGWTSCRGCGQAWSPEYGMHLAALLAQQRREQAGGDTPVTNP